MRARRIAATVLATACAAALLFPACSPQRPEAVPAITRATAIPAGTEAAASPAVPTSTRRPTLDPAVAEQRLMEQSLEFGASFFEAVEEMGKSGNPGFVPALVDLMRFRYTRRQTDALANALVKLTHAQESDAVQPQHRDWGWWVVWLGDNPQIEAVGGYAGWKGRLFGLTDEEMGELLYQDIPSRIRLEEVVWGGVPKDGIPDLEDPPVIPAAEADYLNPRDRVFGVSFNGEHRAYPLRILNPHEMANDVVGGVPFALAY